MFLQNPIIGVGFANASYGNYSFANSANGQCEIGNSYFTVLVMTGIMGFVPFAIMIIEAFLKIFQKLKGKKESNIIIESFFGAELVFYLLHMMGEGYVMSAGSLFFFDFWLTLGCINAYCRTNNANIQLSPMNVFMV